MFSLKYYNICILLKALYTGAPARHGSRHGLRWDGWEYLQASSVYQLNKKNLVGNAGEGADCHATFLSLQKEKEKIKTVVVAVKNDMWRLSFLNTNYSNFLRIQCKTLV